MKASRPPAKSAAKGRGGRHQRGLGRGKESAPSKSSQSVRSNLGRRRELRSKRNLDFPENNFNFDKAASAVEIKIDIHDAQPVSSSMFMGSCNMVLQSPSPTHTARKSVKFVDVNDPDRTVKLVGDHLDGVPEGPTLSKVHTKEQDLLATESREAHHENTARRSSGDLQMLAEFQASYAGDMSENILEDTLSDLNPMSPEAKSVKVNPFTIQPSSSYSRAQVLENREKFDVFQTCPKFVYDKNGKLIRSSKITRTLWEANQSVFESLFQLPIHHDTQAQEEEMRATDTEGEKDA